MILSIVLVYFYFYLFQHFKQKALVHCRIKRVSNSKRICANPTCDAQTQLARINRSCRYYIAKNSNIYVPNYAVACPTHMDHNVWKSTDVREESFDFTSLMVTDMFNLLASPPPDDLLPLVKSTYFFDSYIFLVVDKHTDSLLFKLDSFKINLVSKYKRHSCILYVYIWKYVERLSSI